MSCPTRVIVQAPASRVVVQGGSAKRITLDNSTVAKIVQNRSTTVVAATPQPLRVVENSTTVRAGSNIGPKGPPGQAGGTIAPVAFSYGDAAAPIWEAPAAGTLTIARIKISTAFNDPAATLSLGIPADHDAILPVDLCDCTSLAEFETTPDVRLALGESVVIYPTPGTANQGAGIVFLTFLPD